MSSGRKKYSWTYYQLKLLRKFYPTCKDPRELAKRLKKTYEALKSKAGILKLYRETHVGEFTKKENDYIRKMYPNSTAEGIAKVLGKTYGAICARAFKMRLKKTEQFKSASGKYGRSLQGEPWNKGMKGLITPGSEKGWFKKGGNPANTMPVGTISIRTGGLKRKRKQYTYIKIGHKKWEMLHVHLWKKTHGEIPEGKIIVFEDNDPKNFEISNLICITRQEHVERCRGFDSYIASRMAMKDPVMKNKILQYPELIEMKKLSLTLTKKIKTHEQTQKRRTA